MEEIIRVEIVDTFRHVYTDEKLNRVRITFKSGGVHYMLLSDEEYEQYKAAVQARHKEQEL